MQKLIANFDLCTGCSICLLVCSEVNEGGFNPRLARMRLATSNNGLVTEPIVCNQCSNPYCLQVCPVEAIYIDEKTKVVKISKDKCIGCGLCQEYCPREVIVINNNKAVKCDLCDGNPQCVNYCPTGALKVINRGD